jgi:hypothetical protein
MIACSTAILMVLDGHVSILVWYFWYRSEKELLDCPPEDSFWTWYGPKVAILAAKNAILLYGFSKAP